jgi:pseudouridine-5'-phosphate glycosidase
MLSNNYLSFGAEVNEAVKNKKPIVALESTIISHGMPYPTNLNTTIAVEDIIRKAGVTPATIAILKGVIKIGLTKEEFVFLSKSKNIYKASERDIAFILSKKFHAATTVSASLAIASAAGIHVFATGGIGGVGPHATKTFDISADLISIGKFPCITVCAGAKAFMDIPATLEFLDTHSIPVCVYCAKNFPLFYSRDSGIKIDWEVNNPREVADLFKTQLSIGQTGGMLVAVPIPFDDAIPENEIHEAISIALKEVKKMDIRGKEYTPKVLSLIKEITGGKSLDANVALMKHNAEIASEIAKSISEIMC